MGKFTLGSIKGGETVKEPKLETAQSENLRVGSGFFENLQKQHVGQEVIFVPRSKIVKNPENFYTIGDVSSLAQSIRFSGLSQPLEIKEMGNGQYMLLGGERRLTAIDSLIADPAVDGWTDDPLIACIVKDVKHISLPLSPERKEDFAIITTNKETRVYTDADRYQEIKKWKEIIRELRENGVESFGMEDDAGNETIIPIRGAKTRDILSQTTGISSGQLHKYETVEKSGSKNLQDALLSGKVTVATAAKAASTLEQEEQDALAKAAEKQEIQTDQVAKFQKKEIEEVIITRKEFQKDISGIMDLLDREDVALDETEKGKYDKYVRQLTNLLVKNVRR
ncbi:MAG: ParB N-terminal domain-containing protein [Lachnospiraceae bacterium]|nr:ParB N-terminal domain-containing protein [Lachnospiraceae bacterium]